MSPTVLITGASQGIGQATALQFARNGYNLVLAARNQERLEFLVEVLEKAGHPALAIPTDTQDASQVKELIDRAIAHFGGIDVLVNNAGIYASGTTESFSLEDWHRVIDTNLWGYIHTIHTVLPHFLQRGSGSIINVVSIGGKIPTPYMVPYCTSKFAVTGLTDALRSEIGPKGIHVCGIYPNLIKSDFMQRAVFRGKDDRDTQDRRRQLEQVLSTPVVEKPEDVANAIWDAVKNQREEVVVGSANLSIASHKLFPGLLQWMFHKTFQNQDAR